MFFYDHDMARDDMFDMEPEPKGELDIMDGLRAMSMFKSNPGPLRPSDLNQEIKYALSENPDCIGTLFHEGFMDESLVRELEQMMMDNQSTMMKMPRMTEPGMIVMTQGVIMDETGGPKKKKKKMEINYAISYSKGAHSKGMKKAKKKKKKMCSTKNAKRKRRKKEEKKEKKEKKEKENY